MAAPAAAPPAAARPTSRAPFLMPDGRSLAAVLAQADVAQAGGGPPRAKPRAGRAAASLEARWRRAERARKAAGRPVSTPAGGGAAVAAATTSHPSALDPAPLASLGRARRQRAVNDRVLRDLAGPLTLDGIASLFAPVPFGEVRPSPLARVAADEAPGVAAVWDRFRAVDPDRQDAALAAWEASMKKDTPRNRGTGPAAAAAAALHAWARVAPAARAALKRMGADRVADLEAPLRGQADATVDVALPGDTPYARLLARGVASFYARSARRGSSETETVVIAGGPPPPVAIADVVAALDAPGGPAAALRESLKALADGRAG